MGPNSQASSYDLWINIQIPTKIMRPAKAWDPWKNILVNSITQTGILRLRYFFLDLPLSKHQSLLEFES